MGDIGLDRLMAERKAWRKGTWKEFRKTLYGEFFYSETIIILKRIESKGKKNIEGTPSLIPGFSISIDLYL